MSKKEIAVFSIIVAIIIGGVTGLLVNDYQSDKKYFKNKCEQIGRLANAEVYTKDYGDCFLIHKGHIEKVEL